MTRSKVSRRFSRSCSGPAAGSRTRYAPAASSCPDWRSTSSRCCTTVIFITCWASARAVTRSSGRKAENKSQIPNPKPDGFVFCSDLEFGILSSYLDALPAAAGEAVQEECSADEHVGGHRQPRPDQSHVVARPDAQRPEIHVVACQRVGQRDADQKEPDQRE